MNGPMTHGLRGAADRHLSGEVGERPVRPSAWRTVRVRIGQAIVSARPLSRGMGSVLAVLFLLGGVLAGAVAGGQVPHLVAGMARGVGLTADRVVLAGLVETRESEIIAALQLHELNSLAGFNISEARDRVAQLPWVETVTLRKLYPGRLRVDISEKQAFAVVQTDGQKFVAERSGAIIKPLGIEDLIAERFANLPHLVGKGAAVRANEILPLMANFDGLAGQVQAYVLVSERRWNIVMRNGVVVKLPEGDMTQALATLDEAQADHRLLERQIAIVDLRLPDRMTLRLTSEAATARLAVVSEREKQMQKAETAL